jgi:hypothetical protein
VADRQAALEPGAPSKRMVVGALKVESGRVEEGLGDINRAISLDSTSCCLAISDVWKPLRTDPRFQALVREVNAQRK